MARFKRGDIVKCIEAPDYLDRHISVGTEYVVNKVVRKDGFEYLRILGNDNHGYDLLQSLFVNRTAIGET
jgi:hypothetical protein